MECLGEIIMEKKPLTIFAKRSNLDACGGLNYASGKLANIVMKVIVFFKTIFSNKKIYLQFHEQSIVDQYFFKMCLEK